MKILRRSEGSQLVEFAILLPVLLILAVGIADLSAIAILRDKLTNAAREGARNAISQSTGDLTQLDPPTVEATCSFIQNYLYSANVSTVSACSSSCAAGTSSFTWTCTVGNSSIFIERQVPIIPTGSSTSAVCTRITVTYPYTWIFSYTAQLLGLSNPLPLSSQTVMMNLT